MLAKDNEYMEKAFDRLRHISADEQKQLDYEASMVATMGHNYMMKYSFEEGREEGSEEGIQGTLKILKELGISMEEAIKKVIDKFEMNQADVERLAERYWK